MADSKYALLIRLTDDKQKAAAERMGLAQARLTEARSRLEQLDGFRAEYRHRLTAGASQGMGIAQYQDFRRFLTRLDDAMQQQQLEVERCMQRFLLEKQAWQQEYKKLKAYEKLLERESERALKKQARAQQKMTDEFATRRFWDVKHGDQN
ncbi:flagellar export protein FliJ [Xenophilus sp. AP218F]|nr:flagellar export protein FliJ [Chromobacterium sp. ASV5]OWY39533.1 flagellar export protein FliJ [Xenophilus sp. AP218F]